MQFDLLIKWGKIFNSADCFTADIGIKGEKIVALGQNLPSRRPRKVIDARGKYVIPAGIDVHVHFELPFCGTVSADDFYTGTKAAAMGGVTTIIDYANQAKTLMSGIKQRRKLAEKKVCVDYSLHCAITNWSEKVKKELPEVISYGIPSFKMFMIYESEGWQSDDTALFSALEISRTLPCRIMVHAESERVLNLLIQRYRKIKGIGAYGHVLSRPNFIEEEAIQRAIKWTEATKGRLYIVHMSTGGGAELVKQAQKQGIDVIAETCPQYLLLTEDVFKDKKAGHLFATCPQIKKKSDNRRLWQGIKNGEISIVSTDTCTFTKKQKAMWKGDFTRIPYGIPGVETLVPLIYTNGVLKGRIDMGRFVERISHNPAKIMGLYPRKGAIMRGADADIVIFHPRRKRRIDHNTLATNCDWSPYQGWQVAGFPETTICRGQVIVEQGKFTGQAGYGKFIPRFLP